VRDFEYRFAKDFGRWGTRISSKYCGARARRRNIKEQARLKKNYIAIRSKSLLAEAITSENVVLVRCILATWIELLLQKPMCLLDQTAGPAMLFNHEDLLTLGDVFPVEFEYFICSIQSVKVNDVLQSNCSFTINKDKKDASAPSEGKIEQDVNIWKEQGGSEEELTAFYLPLRCPANMELLRCMLNVSQRLKSVRMFDSELGKAISRYVWTNFGRNQHIANFIWYCIGMILYVVFLVTSILTDVRGMKPSPVEKFINISAKAITSVYFVYSAIFQLYYGELKQKFGGQTRRAYYSNAWNLLDLVVHSCMIYLVQHVGFNTEPIEPEMRILLSATSLLYYTKFLYYFRAFESTGPLIALLVEIMAEMSFYLLIIFTTIVGFAEAFWMLQGKFPLWRDISEQVDDDGDDAIHNPNSGAPANAFGSLKDSIMSVYNMAFSGFDPSVFENELVSTPTYPPCSSALDGTPTMLPRPLQTLTLFSTHALLT
jgi:hypothetical protein